MSSKWNTNDTGGILRKPTNQLQQINDSRSENLLVFGYACKIFRDDEKALFIDQGKHLIPWMGDKDLKIDRYDVRATLPDLSQYEPPCGGYINRLECLSPAEQRAEQLCEEERYYSLYHNEEEEQMYQEEELKRLHQERSTSYGQVGFDYGTSSNQNDETIKDNERKCGNDNENDEVFVAPKGLVIPETIEVPDKMKIHVIIERTAKFISIQGPQMEILIKAKQSNNPQFEFLNQNNRLNAYYKFILTSFKNGTYRTATVDVDKTNENQNDNGQMYLMSFQSSFQSQLQSQLIPKLSPTAGYCDVYGDSSTTTVQIPTIKYKPSANCAYTQLISKIKGVPLPQLNDNDNDEVVYENQIVTNSTISTNLLNVNNENSNDCNTMNVNRIGSGQNDNDNETKSVNNLRNIDDIKKQADVEVKKISTGLMLALNYASDTEDESDNHQQTDTVHSNDADELLNIQIPPSDLRHIIDKTASYVAKNGKKFEDILKVKQDERFLFLNPSNEYHPYYIYKVTGVNPYPTDDSDRKLKMICPVSFSIKPKDETAVAIKPALPQEASDEEMENNSSNNNNFNGHLNVPNNMDNDSINLYNKASNNSLTNRIHHVPTVLLPNQMNHWKSNVSDGSVENVNSNVTSSLSKQSRQEQLLPSSMTLGKSNYDHATTGLTSRLSSSDLDALQQKEMKRAEEKVKDRLAQIAREKLGLISKEKQLQLERRKRAMAFLDQIKSSGVAIKQPKTDSQTDSKADNANNESDSSSVHSIPITSYGDDDRLQSDKEEDDYTIEVNIRSRSKSRSHTSHRKRKKSKHKKKSKKKNFTVSSSRSRSRSRSHSRSHHRRSASRDHKRRKSSTSKKSKRKRHDD